MTPAPQCSNDEHKIRTEVMIEEEILLSEYKIRKLERIIFWLRLIQGVMIIAALLIFVYFVRLEIAGWGFP